MKTLTKLELRRFVATPDLNKTFEYHINQICEKCNVDNKTAHEYYSKYSITDAPFDIIKLALKQVPKGATKFTKKERSYLGKYPYQITAALKLAYGVFNTSSRDVLSVLTEVGGYHSKSDVIKMTGYLKGALSGILPALINSHWIEGKGYAKNRKYGVGGRMKTDLKKLAIDLKKDKLKHLENSFEDGPSIAVKPPITAMLQEPAKIVNDLSIYLDLSEDESLSISNVGKLFKVTMKLDLENVGKLLKLIS